MQVNALHSALAGIMTHAEKAAVSAHNVANINTDEFKALSSTIGSNSAGNPQLHVSESTAECPVYPVTEGSPPAEPYRSLSNVDLAKEIVDIKIASYGYSANVTMAAASSDMVGSILDIIV